MSQAFQSENSNGASNGISMMTDVVGQNGSVFPSDSAMWRISREHVLLLGGAAATVLQVAHPVVALGVSGHSDFRNDTLGRLKRTLDAVYTIAFAPRDRVEAMERQVREIHKRVRGTEPERYSAFSRDAQMWVVATLVQGSVSMYERFVGPLSGAEREAYYHDMREFGRWFGLAKSYGPQTWVEFESYYEGVLAGGELGRLEVSRELAWNVAHPPKPVFLRILWPMSSAVAREYLPSRLREKLGLPSTWWSRLVVGVLDAILPRVLRMLPERVRFSWEYLRAKNG